MKKYSFNLMENILIKGVIVTLVIIIGCMSNNSGTVYDGAIKPLVVTEKVKHDTDDPAIWVNPDDPSKSLIIGTDKDEDGGLYVFNLDGKIIELEFKTHTGKTVFLKCIVVWSSKIPPRNDRHRVGVQIIKLPMDKFDFFL